MCDLLICDCGFFQLATIGSVIGHLSNPLLVLPLKPTMPADSWGGSKSVEPEAPSKLVGAGYQAFEDSVLMKLQKVCICLLYTSFKSNVVNCGLQKIVGCSDSAIQVFFRCYSHYLTQHFVLNSIAEQY
jgi:hypothetical protein